MQYISARGCVHTLTRVCTHTLSVRTYEGSTSLYKDAPKGYPYDSSPVSPRLVITLSCIQVLSHYTVSLPNRSSIKHWNEYHLLHLHLLSLTASEHCKRNIYLHSTLLKKDLKSTSLQNMSYTQLKQLLERAENSKFYLDRIHEKLTHLSSFTSGQNKSKTCLLYTSDAADE